MDFYQAVAAYGKSPDKLSELTEKLVSEMTVKEKLYMLRGHAMKVTVMNFLTSGRYYNAVPYAAGGCKRLGIPPVLFCDGPRGVVLGNSTCFPVPMLRGASFDDELESRIGEAMAEEAIAGGANYFAGICINLLRHPKWGRAQETYGEDPYLLGRMGVALTRAVQKNGMIACPKHFALNSIEDLRFSVDATVSERTLHEVYLPHFKKCIDAGAMSVMGAYNKVNGSYCCENKMLLTDILRDKWGFDGFVISDFVFGVHDAVRSIKAGLDIEMPYSFKFATLEKKYLKGMVTPFDVDVCVKRIVSVLIRSSASRRLYKRDVIMNRKHIALAREAAAKGMVLLKNKNGALPLKENERMAVVGRYADKINVGDHGSSNVYSTYTVTPYRGAVNRFGKDNVMLYNGCEPEQAIQAAQGCDTVIICVGSDYRQEGEFLVNLGNVKKKPAGSGGDRASLRLPSEDVALINAFAETGKKLIVNIMGGSAYIINEWREAADAVLMSFYCGLEGGNALADILSGDVNPSGKLPFTVAANEEDYPAFLHMGDKQREIKYGYYHGYTRMDKKHTEPDYPFGFGLSYTTFSLECCGVAEGVDGRTASVTVNLRNTGNRPGAEVVQLYVSSNGAEADRPVKLLKGFKKVFLAPGETKSVELTLELEDIRFYDEKTQDWVFDKSYTLFCGTDSKCIVPAGTLITAQGTAE